MNSEELLDIIAYEEGYDDVIEMLEDAVVDSIVPGICIYCQTVHYIEPDSEDGYCDSCDKHTVKSCLVLAEVI